MICSQDISAGENVIECSRDIDDLRLKQFFRRKSLWIITGCWWFAATTSLQVKKSLNIFGVSMSCGQKKFAGEEIVEFFQVVDDLRLSQFCRWKSLWMFSGYWWFAAKTILHAKKIFEYFQVIDDLRPRQFCRWKRLWIFPGFWQFAAQTFLQAKQSLNIFGYWWFPAKQFWRRKRLWIFPGCWWFAAQTILQAKQSLNFFGYWWFAAKTNLQAKKTLNVSMLLMIWGQDNSAGEKDFEHFKFVDDFRPRHFCSRNNLWIFPGYWWFAAKHFWRRKKLWIFPGYWWFAAKTILQVKKSFNIFGVTMICG